MGVEQGSVAIEENHEAISALAAAAGRAVLDYATSRREDFGHEHYYGFSWDETHARRFAPIVST
jgi:hypothetical protein